MAKLVKVGGSMNGGNNQPSAGNPPVAVLRPVAIKKGVKTWVGALLTTVIAVVSVALLMAGFGAVGTMFFDNHAKPGAELAGFDITGFTNQQVRDVAATLIDNYQVTLSFDGREVVSTQQELGVSFDLDATVDMAMAAGDQAEWRIRYNPNETKPVPVAMSVDQDVLQSYLDRTFIGAARRSVPAGATYDADEKQFVVIPGQTGIQADGAKLGQMLSEGIDLTTFAVPTIPEEPQISDATAQQAVDWANQQLKTKYTIKAADASYTIPAASLAKWIVFNPDAANGTMTTSIDQDKVTAELPGTLAKKLTTATVSKRIMLGPDGTPLAVEREGHSGTKIKDPQTVTAKVVEALSAGNGLSLKVDVVTDKYKTERVNMDAKYLVPHGEKWVEVNRSTYTLTRWEGTTKIDKYSVVIGYPSTPTPVGVFHVWLKVASQTMSGEGYNIPNVTSVAYFEGENAIHANYWIGRFGQAGSHGCVGMPPAAAKKVYDWIRYGTMVVVHD